MDELRASAASALEEVKNFERKFVVEVPENVIPGRAKHLVVGQMVVFMGDDKRPWVGKLVANDGRSLKVAWYKSQNQKLTNCFTPALLMGGET